MNNGLRNKESITLYIFGLFTATKQEYMFIIRYVIVAFSKTLTLMTAAVIDTDDSIRAIHRNLNIRRNVNAV